MGALVGTGVVGAADEVGAGSAGADGVVDGEEEEQAATIVTQATRRKRIGAAET